MTSRRKSLPSASGAQCGPDKSNAPTPASMAERPLSPQAAQDKNTDREASLRQSRPKKKPRPQDADDEKAVLAAFRTD